MLPIERLARWIHHVFTDSQTHCAWCGGPLPQRGTVYCSDECLWSDQDARAF